MIDLHCHILPGIDDGPESLDESVDMCRMAAQDGIRTIVATPHFKRGIFEPDGSKVIDLAGKLQEAVDVEGLELEILPGADVAVVPGFLDCLKDIEYLTINGSKRYFLAELPHHSAPRGWDKLLLSALDEGLTPVLTHPERNPTLARNPGSISTFVNGGGLVQVTAGSITGEFGHDAVNTCSFLLARGLVHVIATDAHSSKYRTPRLSRAVKMASDIIGKQRALDLVSTVPSVIITGGQLPMLHGIAAPAR